MAQNSRAKRSEKELLTLTLASGVTIPDSKMARAVTQLVRDTENSLLFNDSSRVYYFAAATGKRKGRTFDPELLSRRSRLKATLVTMTTAERMITGSNRAISSGR